MSDWLLTFDKPGTPNGEGHIASLQHCVITMFEAMDRGYKSFTFKMYIDGVQHDEFSGYDMLDALKLAGINTGYDLNDWMDRIRQKFGVQDTSPYLWDLLEYARQGYDEEECE